MLLLLRRWAEAAGACRSRISPDGDVSERPAEEDANALPGWFWARPQLSRAGPGRDGRYPLAARYAGYWGIVPRDNQLSALIDIQGPVPSRWRLAARRTVCVWPMASGNGRQSPRKTAETSRPR